MATKTFKIGLSNTDKQNMEQDVYERLLALTFPEYDTGTSYEVGDFVVYNDQLYKCIGATSGAWDSTKWQLATLNDLVTDIEDAVQFVNDKANVDGNYPTMTVGAADNLTPYSEDSGDDQDVPFNFQGTGCGNGETQVDTGALALLKEKRGNTVCVNQQITNGDFSNGTTDWSIDGGSFTVSSGVATINFNANDNAKLIHTATSIAGHKYLSCATLKANDSDSVPALFSILSNSFTYKNISTNVTSWNTIFLLEDVSSVFYAPQIQIRNVRASAVADTTIQVKNVFTIDLTQWFGSNDNIPSHLLAHPEDFFRYYQGDLSYNQGELVNANGRYLKAIGRNQWDEEWEVGELVADSLNSKNYIKVIPNVEYLFHSSSYPDVYFYDINHELISILPLDIDATFTTPSNCFFIKFRMAVAYGTTYNNDITISLYYSGESGYDQYYPYEELTDNDTGTEVLRSAGNVADIKKPDGSIVRNVGVVDLGTLSWTYTSSSGGLFQVTVSWKGSGNNSTPSNILCTKYQTVAYNTTLTTDLRIGLSGDGDVLCVKDTSFGTDAAAFKTAMSGVYLFYELATPTTEQGTTFSENIAIDDFGSMEFSGTNGVPQGNLIFYPVDYKAFLDTFYNQVGGDGSNVLPLVGENESLSQGSPETLKQVLDYIDGLHAIEQANAGGTLRHMLANEENIDFFNTDYVDLGTLDWSYYGEYGGHHLFFSDSLSSLISYDNYNKIHAICSTYKSYTDVYSESSGDYVLPNMAFRVNRYNGRLYFNNDNYSSWSTFQDSVKGILLAYEKGE